MTPFDGLWSWCTDTLKTGDWFPLSEMAAILHPLVLLNTLFGIEIGA
jgi:hypothetical protein